MRQRNSIRLTNHARQTLGLKQKVIIGVIGGSFLILAGVMGVMKVMATYTISGYAFLDYSGDETENGPDERQAVVTIGVYSDEDDSGDLSTGDVQLAMGITDSIGNYSIGFSTGSNTYSTRIGSEKDDAEEDISDGDMYLTSSDLEMVRDGGTTQLVGIRFSTVNLPAGATVTAAYIRFRAKNTNSSNKTFKIQGEKEIFSEPITQADSNISKRDTTTLSASWTISTWNADSYYNTADLTDVVNEIRNQSGWVPGNPMMFMISGTSGTKNAYSGPSIGPELYIDYTLPPMTHDFIIAPDTNLLFPESTAGEAVVPAGSASDIAVSYRGESLTCYVVSDDDPNTLLFMNRISRTHSEANNATGANDIEAIAFDPTRTVLFAADGDRLGTLNLVSGIFTGKPSTFGTAEGASGPENLTDVDGLSLDPFSGKMYATERESGNDLLFVVDTATGEYVPDAFGSDIDYVVISGTGLQPDIDDIAISPVDGKLYGVSNGDGTKDYDFLIEIDKTTGASTIVDTFKFNGEFLEDIEGLSFTNFGQMVASSGDGGGTSNSDALYKINEATAVGTRISRYNPSADYESCDCLTAAANLLEGYVFNDLDSDGNYNGSDTPIPGVRVRIYRDVDQSGTLNPGDILIDSLDTNASGYYSWSTASNQDFVTEVVTSTAPAGYVLTTFGEWDVLFNQNFGGTTDSDNDFGFIDASSLPVEWLSFTAVWDNEMAALEWTTGIETNSSHFLVERSIDGNSFKSLGQVEASGVSNSPSNYFYTDSEAGQLKVDKLYYRLKQVDLDGIFEYSDVVELNGISQELFLTLSIHPNPATDWLNVNVQGLSQHAGILSIINTRGQVVESQKLEVDQPQVKLRASNWSTGLYIVMLEYEGESVSQKLIVK